MLTHRLPYKFLLAFLSFFFILIVPFSVVVIKDHEVMMERIDHIEPLSVEQKSAYDLSRDKMKDDILVLSFYVFILAFIFSLFFARNAMAPVRQLYRGIRDIEEGKFDTRLEVAAGDDLGEVTRAFNLMADSLAKQSRKLRRKDLYLNSMVDPMWVVDEDNVIVDTNDSFSRLLGYEREEVVGSSIFDFLDEEGERVVRRKSFERSPNAAAYELSIISRTEGLIPVLLSVSPIVEDGEVTGKTGVLKDFRREAALREALREEKENTEAIMDSMVEHMVVIDRDYRIVRANTAARLDMGMQLMGATCSEVFHGGKGRCFMSGGDCPARIVFDTGKAHRTVHEHVQAGNRIVYAEVAAYPVKDHRGEVKYVALNMRDVTERRKFEDEIEQKNRELTTLNSVSKILSRSLKAEEIFNSVLEKIMDVVGMEGGGIYLMDEMHRDLRCVFHKGVSGEFLRSTGNLKPGDDIPGRVALTGNVFLSSDVSRDERAEKSTLKHSGIKAYACFPVRGKERLIGVFFLLSFKSHVFSSEEERTFNSVGEMLGLSFENVRLYEKMRELYDQNRKRRAEERRTLLDLSTMMATTLDLEEVLASFISLIRKTCRADFVWLLGHAEDGLVLRAASDSGFFERDNVYPAGSRTIESHAMETKAPFVKTGLSSDKDFLVDRGLANFNTACSIPLHVGDRTIGAFTLYYTAAKGPRDEEVHFLQTVGSVLAVALERTRLYENVIIQRSMAEAVLESITDGVVAVDRDGGVLSMNSAAAVIIGVAPELAKGSGLADLLGGSPENVELGIKVQDCLEQALRGRVTASEANFVSREGRRLPLVFRSAPVLDEKGDTAGVVYVLRDLSMEKELDAMKSDFIRNVSHEFRTPLTAIVGMTEMLLEGEVDKERSGDYLATVLSEANRLSDMVGDVLDLARIERGKEIFTRETVDFPVLLKGVGDVFEDAIKRKGAAYAWNLDGDVTGFRGDAESLKQMVRNLVENSLTYSDPGCRIEVDVSGTDGRIVIKVSDTGWGIGGDELPHVAEKFYRGKSSSGTKGSGLGLSLARETARMHGGGLTVESEAGKGTTVVVELPKGGNDEQGSGD